MNMTEGPNRYATPFIELMYYLFEDAVKRGEIPPGEYITIISGDALPGNEANDTHTKEEVPEICEPVSEHHEYDGVVTITADLAGTSPEDIRHTLHHGVLYLAAHAGDRIYRAAYPVEERTAETLIHTFKNGIIEFTYQKKDQNPEENHSDYETEESS